VSGPRFTIRVQKKDANGKAQGSRTVEVPIPNMATANDNLEAQARIDEALSRVARRAETAALELIEDYPEEAQA
jgi:hypothetical protein